MLIDTHAHAQLGSGRGSHLAAVVLASTQRNDWELVKRYEAGPVFARAYGVHPWWPSSENFLGPLEALLKEEPSALVGEIGLDGLRPNFDLQLSNFRGQFELAADLDRPITTHCVKAFGPLRTVFEETTRLPPAIAMHSYTGSWDFARDLNRLAEKKGSKLYFGFSNFVNGRQKAARREALIKKLPDDRILIESDLEDAAAIDDHLDLALKLVAQAKGWTTDQTIAQCQANAHTFIQKGCSSLEATPSSSLDDRIK